MKKIIIFGSTGTIGKPLVEQALVMGYQVTAFARSRERVQSQHQRLSIFTGDVLDPVSVEKAVQGHDIVMVVLGAGRKGVIRSKGTKNIILAMEKVGVKRLICQSTLGAGDSKANLNFFWKRVMFGWFLKEAFLDHELQEQYVKDSQLDWTIVRPGAFTDGALTGEYKHGFSPEEKSIKLKISRPDLVQFLLNQVQDNQYLHKTPALSY